jgi:hypothetical protein
VLARLLPDMPQHTHLEALYDLAGWQASLRRGEAGVGEQLVANCMPALRAQVDQELRDPGGDPRRDLEVILRAYCRYDAVAQFRREYGGALSRIQVARHRVAVDGRYRLLLEAWAHHDHERAAVAIAQMSATDAAQMRLRDDFEQQAHLREALVLALRAADTWNAVARWSSTFTLASHLVTREPVAALLAMPENLVLFARPWLRYDDAAEARVDAVRIAPDAAIPDGSVRAVLQATLRVLDRFVPRVHGLPLSGAAIARAAASPHAEIAAAAVRVSRILEWHEVSIRGSAAARSAARGAPSVPNDR